MSRKHTIMGISLFKPECGAHPIFLSESVSSQCGFWSSLISALIMLIICLIIATFVYKVRKYAYDQNNQQDDGHISPTTTLWIGISISIILAVIVFFIKKLSVSSKWQTYQFTKNNLIATGKDPGAAIESVIQMDTASRMTDAMRGNNGNSSLGAMALGGIAGNMLGRMGRR